MPERKHAMSKIDTIVIHYSATFADQNLTVKDIDKMHRDRGWKMVGYHWVIRRDGVVEQGRPEAMVGAHVGGQNTGKIGICCIGGLDRATGPNKGVDNRTPQQIESLIKLIRECLKRYPGAKVVGHRDLAATQCPGFDVRAWWAKVQKKAAPDPVPSQSGAPAKTPVISEDMRHVVAKGETWWSVANMYGIALGDLLLTNGADPDDVLVIGRTLSLKVPVKTVKIDKPVVPQSVDQAVQKTSQQGGWLSGIGAVAGSGLSAVLGADWETVAVIGGVGVGVGILALVAGPVIVSRIRSIRQAVEAG
jgi:N-acetylmuramoyl-L-alanine amidase